VQVAREVERLIDEGASLSADDAQALERHLEQRPDDLGARARLLGYQQAQARKVYEGMTIRQRVEYAIRTERDNSFLDARARHALWLAVKRAAYTAGGAPDPAPSRDRGSLRRAVGDLAGACICGTARCHAAGARHLVLLVVE